MRLLPVVALAMIAVAAPLRADPPAAPPKLSFTITPERETVLLRGMALAPLPYGLQQPRKRKIGMIASTEVSPNLTVGLGLFDGVPRYRSSADASADGKVKTKRRAAVGMSFKF